jgi:hypothetical protein
VTELLAHLSDDTQAVVGIYLAELEAALAPMRAVERLDALADTEEYFAERLHECSTPDDAEHAARELGSPVEFADGMLAALGRRPGRTTRPAGEATAAEAEPAAVGAGRVLGVPYDVRVPTAGRIASRWWDPRNPRVFVPRVFGIGWDVNFGYLAVLLGLIRPDDEDELFGAVPAKTMAIALMIPVALTLFIVGLQLLFAGRLPAELPSHWDFAGQPDQFWGAAQVLGFNLTLAAVPTAYAIFCLVAGRTRLQQATTIALASLMSGLAAGIYLQAVLWGLGVVVPYFAVAVIAFGLGLPFAELTILARIGRAHEWRRDLSPAHREER